VNFSILKIKIEKSGIGGDDYRHYKTKEIEKAREITMFPLPGEIKRGLFSPQFLTILKITENVTKRL